jgi:predicted DNA-binding protein
MSKEKYKFAKRTINIKTENQNSRIKQTIYLSEELYEKLWKLRVKRRKNISFLIKEALESYLKEGIEDEVAAVQIGELIKAIQKAKASLNKGLQDAENVFAEIRKAKE